MTAPQQFPTCAKSGEVFTGTEKAYMLFGQKERFDGTSPVIFAFHGLGRGADFISPISPTGSAIGVHHRYLSHIANHGYIVISSAWGGDLLGNTGQKAIVEAAYDAVQADPRFPDGPVGVYAGSGGNPAAMNWWDSEPTHVGAYVGVVPVVNLDHVYDDNDDLQDEIDAAYGGDYAANGTAHSPHAFAEDLPLIPGVFLPASDDDIVRFADAGDVAAALGFDLFDIGPGGHTALESYSADVRLMLSVYEELG